MGTGGKKMTTNRTFRIFVSSTFSDFKEERKALQNIVFPKLRELCEKNGCRFQAIDLRWGVSNEAAYDQQAVRICLEEITRCQKVSPKPNFILLLGNRYGWRPLPAEITAAEFEKLLGSIPDSDEKVLLEKWYRRDDNAIPPEYCLQPRITEEDRNQENWDKIERTLHTLLKNAAIDTKIPEKDFLKYTASATEQEIIRGVIQVPDAGDHVFGFFRDIDDLPVDTNGGNFIDLDAQGRPDSVGRDDAERLKKNVLDNLGERNVKSYRSSWTGNGITYDHIPKFCDGVYASLEKIILGQIENLEIEDDLENEITAHQFFGTERVKHFVGRKDLLRDVSDYLDHGDPAPLAVYGESGSGKTAFIAKCVEEAKYTNPNAVIVSRFIGATSSSTNIPLLLESLCTQISRGYSVDTSDIPKEYGKLVNEFPARLRLATSDKPLIIFLDALNQLTSVDQGGRLIWFPPTLPQHVKIIVSAIPGEDLTVLKRILPDTNIKKVEPLVNDEGRTLLDSWLDDANRALQPEQRNEVLTNLTRNGLPLYLKMAFEEARRWKSYTPDYRLSETIPGIIQENLLKRLSSETNHGPKLVSWSLGYLAASRYGLAEDELIDLISTSNSEVFNEFRQRAFSIDDDVQELPVIIWSRLYFDLEPYFMQRSVYGVPLLTFYHQQLAETIENLFVSGNAKILHVHLADYFSKRSHTERKVDELPWQLEKAEEWTRLKDIISDSGTFQSLITEVKKYELVKYWLSIGNRYNLVTAYVLMLNKKIEDPNRSKVEVAALLHQVALFLTLTGHYNHANQFFVRSIQISEIELGLEHPDTATRLDNYGSMLMNLGAPFIAEPYCYRALTIREKIFGPEHPDTITSMNNIVTILIFTNRSNQAIQYCKRNLVICEKVLGPEHPNTVICLENLAALYPNYSIKTYWLIFRDIDNLKILLSENVTLYRRVLDIREKIFGPDHPDTGKCLLKLAGLLLVTKNSFEARNLFQRVLVIDEKHLGTEHPQIATDLLALGISYGLSGKLADVERILRRILVIYGKAFGESSFSQAFILINLELIILAQCKFGEGIHFFITGSTKYIKTGVNALINMINYEIRKIFNCKRNQNVVISSVKINKTTQLRQINLLIAFLFLPILCIPLILIIFLMMESSLIIKGNFHDAGLLLRWPFRVLVERDQWGV